MKKKHLQEVLIIGAMLIFALLAGTAWGQEGESAVYISSVNDPRVSIDGKDKSVAIYIRPDGTTIGSDGRPFCTSCLIGKHALDSNLQEAKEAAVAGM